MPIGAAFSEARFEGPKSTRQWYQHPFDAVQQLLLYFDRKNHLRVKLVEFVKEHTRLVNGASTGPRHRLEQFVF